MELVLKAVVNPVPMLPFAFAMDAATFPLEIYLVK